MVTVCISTNDLSSVFISPDLSDTKSFHQCCWSIIPVTDCSYRLQQSCSQHTCIWFCCIRLIQPWQPNRLFQSDTVSSEQSVGDNSLIQLRYHICIRPEGATGCNRSVAFLRVYVTWKKFSSSTLNKTEINNWCFLSSCGTRWSRNPMLSANQSVLSPPTVKSAPKRPIYLTIADRVTVIDWM